MKKLTTVIAVITAVGLMFTVAACTPKDEPQAQESETAVQETAPEAQESEAAAQESAPEEKTGGSAVENAVSFSAEDINGNAADESIFADSDVNMINIWGTFCGPCINEMPDLAAISTEYKDAGKSFAMFGIVGDARDAQGAISDDIIAAAKDIVKETGADVYTHLLPSDDLWSLYMSEMYAYPTTVFVDRGGNLIGEVQVGSQTEEAWREIIDGLLAEYGK